MASRVPTRYGEFAASRNNPRARRTNQVHSAAILFSLDNSGSASLAIACGIVAPHSRPAPYRIGVRFLKTPCPRIVEHALGLGAPLVCMLLLDSSCTGWCRHLTARRPAGLQQKVASIAAWILDPVID